MSNTSGTLPLEDPNVLLLRSLLRAHDMSPAPRTITLAPGHQLFTVGIGADHHADILIHNDALVALQAMAGD
jgi:hypothetical protein